MLALKPIFKVFLGQYLRVVCNLFSDLLMISRFVLSRKWWTLQCFIATWRSWMYSRKSPGPKTVPCGTPQVILEILYANPLINTICLKSTKYDLNHLFASSWIQWWNNLVKRMLWSTVSKAFWRSTKISHAKLPSSRAFIIAKVRFARAYEVE